MKYEKALSYLNSFINYEKISDYSYTSRSFNLKRIKSLLSLLDNPQQKLSFLHIAGTKGKGSTAAFVGSVLKEAGFKAGLYTSPHLIDFRERIRVNNKLISKQELRHLINRLEPYVDRLQKKSQFGSFTFFEIYTSLAFLFFVQKKVDIAVLEVGLGGRLDATNVIEPLVCAITEISFDHTEKLGNTLSLIAREKAGIIKENSLVVISPQKLEVLAVIRKIVKRRKAKLWEVGKDIKVNPQRTAHSPQPTDFRFQTFGVQGIWGDYERVTIPLLGEHQQINAACAIGILELLRFHNINISQETIKQGLRKVDWPGRLEIVGERPFIVLDGAQNESSAKALKESIKLNFPYKKLILILGISQDKDIKGVGRTLCPLADRVILTKVNSPRAAEPSYLKKELKGFSQNTTLIPKVNSAFQYAKLSASPEDLICITGSLYLVGEIKQIVNKL